MYYILITTLIKVNKDQFSFNIFDLSNNILIYQNAILIYPIIAECVICTENIR